jgi:hypothetical protein
LPQDKILKLGAQIIKKPGNLFQFFLWGGVELLPFAGKKPLLVDR